MPFFFRWLLDYNIENSLRYLWKDHSHLKRGMFPLINNVDKEEAHRFHDITDHFTVSYKFSGFEIEVGVSDLRKRHRLTKGTLKTLIDNVVFSEVREQLVKDEKLKEDVEDRRKQIYLTKEELKYHYEMPLTGTEAKVRDLFLIGCYTGQRFSDYSKIDERNIGYTQNGTKVIRLYQKKTKCQVVIPILNDELEVLLKKYNYCVPTISDQELNDHIKNICHRLSETVPSLTALEQTLLTKTERELEQKKKVSFKRNSQGDVIKHRWEMVASHTARRTMITNMYLSRKFSLQQIMTVSGHKKEETLKRYLKLSLDEFADDVAQAGADGLF